MTDEEFLRIIQQAEKVFGETPEFVDYARSEIEMLRKEDPDFFKRTVDLPNDRHTHRDIALMTRMVEEHDARNKSAN